MIRVLPAEALPDTLNMGTGVSPCARAQPATISPATAASMTSTVLAAIIARERDARRVVAGATEMDEGMI
jgi:hypothetical protein